MNIQEPLKPGCFTTRETGEKLWLAFKYERLSDFCYGCGKIDHTMAACSGESQGDMRGMRVEQGWGPWQRAWSKGSARRPEQATTGDFLEVTQTKQKGKEETMTSMKLADVMGQNSNNGEALRKETSDTRNTSPKVKNPLPDISY